MKVLIVIITPIPIKAVTTMTTISVTATTMLVKEIKVLLKLIKKIMITIATTLMLITWMGKRRKHYL